MVHFYTAEVVKENGSQSDSYPTICGAEASAVQEMDAETSFSSHSAAFCFWGALYLDKGHLGSLHISLNVFKVDRVEFQSHFTLQHDTVYTEPKYEQSRNGEKKAISLKTEQIH